MRRDKPQRERDKQIIADMYLKGHSCRAIAVHLCEANNDEKYLSYRTVANEINKLLKEWHDERIDDIHKQKTLELEKLNKLERTYWIAWEKSISDYEKRSKRLRGTIKGDGGKSSPSEQEIATIEMVSMGNPSYLAGVERCIERRCKILGIDAPQKHDITSNGKGFLDFLKESSADPETENE